MQSEPPSQSHCQSNSIPQDAYDTGHSCRRPLAVQSAACGALHFYSHAIRKQWLSFRDRRRLAQSVALLRSTALTVGRE